MHPFIHSHWFYMQTDRNTGVSSARSVLAPWLQRSIRAHNRCMVRAGWMDEWLPSQPTTLSALWMCHSCFWYDKLLYETGGFCEVYQIVPLTSSMPQEVHEIQAPMQNKTGSVPMIIWRVQFCRRLWYSEENHTITLMKISWSRERVRARESERETEWNIICHSA